MSSACLSYLLSHNTVYLTSLLVFIILMTILFLSFFLLTVCMKYLPAVFLTLSLVSLSLSLSTLNHGSHLPQDPTTTRKRFVKVV